MGNVIVVCDNCGKEFESYKCYEKRNRKHRFCSKKCEGEYRSLKNTLDGWQGGHVSKSTGYRYVYINGKQVEEHRLVMMRELGRELRTDEQVHHLNGNKLDNRPENLVVLTNSEHQKKHARKKTIASCKLCGRVRTIYSRGLCNSCYHRALAKGELCKYEK